MVSIFSATGTQEAQQNRIIKYNCEQGCAKVIIRMRDHRRLIVDKVVLGDIY